MSFQHCVSAVEEYERNKLNQQELVDETQKRYIRKFFSAEADIFTSNISKIMGNRQWSYTIDILHNDAEIFSYLKTFIVKVTDNCVMQFMKYTCGESSGYYLISRVDSSYNPDYVLAYL